MPEPQRQTHFVILAYSAAELSSRLDRVVEDGWTLVPESLTMAVEGEQIRFALLARRME